MGSSIVPIGIGVVLLLAVVGLVVTARQRPTTRRVTRETRRRDHESASGADQGAPRHSARSREHPREEARARVDEARRAIEPSSAVPVTTGKRAPARYEPVDEEAVGVTRRQFFNRSILTGLGLGVGAFGVASLGFLWPSGAGGFGGKIQVGGISDVHAAFNMNQPFYNAAAKAYVVAYPKADLSKAKKVPAYTAPIIAGMELGYVALYHKCPHLGCRVPWCQSSQWFECPCHGSKYNRVGEKRGGPAPRGMDRFPLSVSGDTIVVDTSIIVPGPPIGTDTTGQAPEGALCV